MNESVECLGGESSGCFAESIEDALDVADRMAEETTERIHMKKCLQNGKRSNVRKGVRSIV